MESGVLPITANRLVLSRSGGFEVLGGLASIGNKTHLRSQKSYYADAAAG